MIRYVVKGAVWGIGLRAVIASESVVVPPGSIDGWKNEGDRKGKNSTCLSR